MRRFKNWIINKYLPSYARVLVYEEIEKLRQDSAALKQAVEEQRATIAALKYALECGRLLEIQLKGVDNYEYVLKRPEADKSHK